MPGVNIGKPAGGHTNDPQGQTQPALPECKRLQLPQLRNGVEADSQDERTDPPEQLRVAMGLNPGRRNGVDRLAAANLDEIPHAKKGSRQQHKDQAGDDEGHQ